MYKYGFIGMGNMGYAILKGLLNNTSKEEIIITDVNKERMADVARETGVDTADSNAECANKAKYIVLCIKPQFFDQVLKNLENVVTEDKVIISIAPGQSIGKIKEALLFKPKVVRAMPNTPALVGEGITGVSYDEKELYVDEISDIHNFFTSFGKMEVVAENLMNAVTVVSGSSPAYVYMFIEALADSAVKYGIPRDKALKMAAQTVLGSAKMALESGKHPGELKDMVCSPAGTTICGVSALEECGFRSAVIKAGDAVYNKFSD